MAANHVQPDRNIALELVRTTEAAAIAAARHMGRGDKIKADQAAVDAMRHMLSGVEMDGLVIIGEGEKDEAPMLFNGEFVGNGEPPHTDVAVDPIDGTTLTAQGQAGAIAVIAVADRGSMFDPGPCFYMEKLAVGPAGVGVVSLDNSVQQNVKDLAQSMGKPASEITAVVLDRPRHEELIAEIRSTGARIALIKDGDVAGAIATAWPESGIDILFGIGGTPEAVITAAALKSMGGDLQGRLWAADELQATQARDQGYDLGKVLGMDDLINTDNCFFAATGITTGDLLEGVKFTSTGMRTQSLVMRSRSGTVRLVEGIHRKSKFDSILEE